MTLIEYRPIKRWSKTIVSRATELGNRSVEVPEDESLTTIEMHLRRKYTIDDERPASHCSLIEVGALPRA